ncbi:hypothetical protein LshimejAT787_2201000 [Lyophyllum shimeji]|uniref:Uncharacterized protein n=1 Tax=Lyophyllum shimeji TaxID=47721 RepID=A0A9P3Q261_LYOSH|nr:hypothetical protein LshimejAT787_2201000 [Lyophyllum shimeji]
MASLSSTLLVQNLTQSSPKTPPQRKKSHDFYHCHLFRDPCPDNVDDTKPLISILYTLIRLWLKGSMAMPFKLRSQCNVQVLESRIPCPISFVTSSRLYSTGTIEEIEDLLLRPKICVDHVIFIVRGIQTCPSGRGTTQ